MSSNSRQIKSIVIIMGLLIVISSCKTVRSIYKAPLKEQGASYLFNQLKENELSYDYFNAKFNLNFTKNKKKTSFKGQIRIQKDSMIWVSFSPLLGIEVARMLITTDSVKFINRMNKTFFKGDYKYLNDYLDTNLDFDILQALIMGNDLRHYENGKFRASIDKHQYKLSTAARHKLKKFVKSQSESPQVYIQNIWLDPETFKISQVSLKEIKKEHKKLQANYEGFLEVNEQLFPKNVYFDLHSESRIEVKLAYSKITVNKALNFPFRVPKRYKSVVRLDK